MLYVFHVDAGQMTTYDMSLTLQNVASLKLAIERKTKVPSGSLVLLVSGGEVLQHDHMVSSYSAGTDTNPIYMFIKPSVKESHLKQSMCSDLSPIVELSIEFSSDKSVAELKQAVDKCCSLAPTVHTVKSCAALAQQFSELAHEVSRSCEQLVHEQHLQHQGWAAVVANLEDIFNEFCERSRNFKESFKKHRLKKEEYHKKLNELNAVLEFLGTVPILPALQLIAESHRFSAFDVFEETDFEGHPYRVTHPLDSSSEKQNQDFGVEAFKFSEEDVFVQKDASSSKETAHSSEAVPNIEESDEGVTFKTHSYEGKEESTLLHWILAQGNKASLQDILDYCQKGLALIDAEPLKEREAELYNILEYANNHGLKQIKGIEDRLYGLDQLLNDVKKLERDQHDQAASLIQYRERLNSACDPSVLPTLVQSHWCQLKKLLKGHQMLFDIRRRIAKSKDELSHILKARLEQPGLSMLPSLTSQSSSTLQVSLAGPSTSTGPPLKTNLEQLKKERKSKVADKKKLNKLSPKQKAAYMKRRERSQVSRTLLPDAPARKQKRKSSPARIACPLLPGVPLVPPPRKIQPWERMENEKRDSIMQRRCDLAALPTSCPSRFSMEFLDINDSIPDPQSPPVKKTKTKTPVKKTKTKMFTPSSGILQAESQFIDPLQIVDAEIEVIDFTPKSNVPSNTDHSKRSSPMSFPGPSGLPGPSELPGPSVSDLNIFDETDAFEREWVETDHINPGSDIDEDLPESEAINVECSRANNIFCPPDNLPCDMMALLSEMDKEDDIALREMASNSDLDMTYFKWSNNPETFNGQQEEFTGEAGPTFDLEGLTPIDVFQKIWDDGIINTIVEETNRYGRQLKMKVQEIWTDINAVDIWVFFAILMLQSILPIPVEKEYWYPCLAYLKLTNFSRLMPYKKFKLIKKCLHFVDNTVLPQVSGKNKDLKKIWPIIEHLNDKFSSLYLPEQYIAIDESLLLWKGRLSFVQLIATKAARVGIKSYELCESRTGYLWKMLIYTGKEKAVPDQNTGTTSADEPAGTTSKIVFNLVRPLLNRGHTLVMDNFYNSPLLSRTLKRKKTDTMGTLRLNRQYVPNTLSNKTKSDIRAGEILFSQTEDLSICVWHDSNIVSMISTYHKPGVGGKEKHGIFKYKPQVVLDYNLTMGGVDKKDQMLQAFPVERVRNQVWYKKVFRRLLNVSIYNAFVMYNHKHDSNQRQFRVTLADEILKKMLPLMQTPNPREKIQPERGHYPTKNETGRSRCKWCSKKKKTSRTAWKCRACNINLCIYGCFGDYHDDLFS